MAVTADARLIEISRGPIYLVQRQCPVGLCTAKFGKVLYMYQLAQNLHTHYGHCRLLDAFVK